MKFLLAFGFLAIAYVNSLPHKESKSGQLCKGSSYRYVHKAIRIINSAILSPYFNRASKYLILGT